MRRCFRRFWRGIDRLPLLFSVFFPPLFGRLASTVARGRGRCHDRVRQFNLLEIKMQALHYNRPDWVFCSMPMCVCVCVRCPVVVEPSQHFNNSSGQRRPPSTSLNTGRRKVLANTSAPVRARAKSPSCNFQEATSAASGPVCWGFGRI